MVVTGPCNFPCLLPCLGRLPDDPCPCLFLRLLPVQLPRVVHHLFEVSVVVNTSRYVIVVFFKFFISDIPISPSLVCNRVVQFESLQEVPQDVVLSLPACPHIGVVPSVVHTFYVVYVDQPTIVLVQLPESLDHKALAEIVHRAAHPSQKFVIIQNTIFISITGGKYSLNIFIRYIQPEVSACFNKFVDT